MRDTFYQDCTALLVVFVGVEGHGLVELAFYSEDVILLVLKSLTGSFELHVEAAELRQGLELLYLVEDGGVVLLQFYQDLGVEQRRLGASDLQLFLLSRTHALAKVLQSVY